jgi:hypothetical protein
MADADNQPGERDRPQPTAEDLARTPDRNPEAPDDADAPRCRSCGEPTGPGGYCSNRNCASDNIYT